MRVHKEHRIECTPERLQQLSFDPEVERRMNLEAMGSQDLQLLEHRQDDKKWLMRCRITPKDNMPGFIKKLVGGAFTMEEERSLDKVTGKAGGVMTPSALKEKVRMAYDLKVVPDGEGACRRIMDWEVEVKVFGIGGQIEKFILGEIERGLDTSARFLNEYVRAQKAS